MPSVKEEYDRGCAAAYTRGWDEAYAVAFGRGKRAGEASSHETINALRVKLAQLQLEVRRLRPKLTP